MLDIFSYIYRGHIITNDNKNFSRAAHPKEQLNENVNSKKYDTSYKSFSSLLFLKPQTNVHGNRNGSSRHKTQNNTKSSVVVGEETVISHKDSNYTNAAAQNKNSLQRKMSSDKDGNRKTFKKHFAQKHESSDNKVVEKTNRKNNNLRYWNTNEHEVEEKDSWKNAAELSNEKDTMQKGKHYIVDGKETPFTENITGNRFSIADTKNMKVAYNVDKNLNENTTARSTHQRSVFNKTEPPPYITNDVNGYVHSSLTKKTIR